MSSTQELIRRCVVGDNSAVNELWVCISKLTPCHITRLLRVEHCDVSESDDIALEFWIYLQADNWHRLRAFRGTTEASLCSWLSKVLRGFGSNFLRDQRRHHKVDRLVSLPVDLASPRDLTPEDILRSLEELIRIMTLEDRIRFHYLRHGEWLDSSIATTDRPRRISKRTGQLWAKQLFEKYHDRI